MIRSKKLLALLLLLVLAVPISIARGESIKVYVSSNTVKCYGSCSATGKSVELGYGEPLTCVEVKNGWAKVQNSAGSAYCRTGSLTTKNPNTYSVTAYATKATHLYSLPTRSSSSSSLAAGDRVTLLCLTPDGRYCRAEKGGKTGYVLKSDFSTTKPSSAAADETDSTEQEAASPAKTSPAKETVSAEKPAETVKASEKYIKVNTAHLYEKKASGKLLATMPFAATVSCDGVEGSYSHVTYNGKTGWCLTSNLTPDNPNVKPVMGYIKAANAKAYSLPVSSSTVMGTLKQGTQLGCVAITPDAKWVRVTTSGKYGYVLKSQMALCEEEDPVSSKVDKIISLAKEQLGKSYVYATHGPSTFDCSGLTLYVYQQVAGISLGRSAQSQGYNENFTKIESISDLKKGDLVFFNTEDDNDLTDHVGIYLGSGQFIHASSARGEVMISSLSSGYYNRVFAWGRRLLK